MEVKNHYLKTMQDVLEVVDQNNMEFFLEDFRLFITEVVKAKMVNKLAYELSGEKEIPLELENFHWIEDGKHDNHGTFITATDGKNSVTIDVNHISDKIAEHFNQ